MNRKNLTAAVLAGLAGAAGIVGSAQAVNINPDGLGQVLIYPYYTVNGGNTTVLSVVNTTIDAKAVKVRFMEGQNSREVLDFNLYLSGYDVWTASLRDEGGTPTMRTADTSCTVPYFYDAVDGYGDQEFLPWRLDDTKFQDVDADGDPRYPAFDADGNLDPTAFDDISRAAEGHFEMIEMGTLVDGEVDNTLWVNTEAFEFCVVGSDDVYGNPSDAGCPTGVVGTNVVWSDALLDEDETLTPYGSASAATHDDGVPADCGQLVDAWTYGATSKTDGYWLKTDGAADIDAPSGGLFGGAAVVDVANGAMYSYDAKAIDGFWADTVAHEGAGRDDPHQEPGTILPSLDSGGNPFASVFVDGDVIESGHLARGVDAVSYVFMHDQIMNEYTTEAVVGAATEWVVTFPTKQFYVHDLLLQDIADFRDEPAYDAPVDPFLSEWKWIPTSYDDDDDVIKEGRLQKACEVVSLTGIWDREEGIEAGPGDPDDPRPPIVSPRPPGYTAPSDGVEFFELCYETSVIAFGDDDGDETAILASSNFHRIDNTALGYEAGWARLNLVDASADLNQDGTVTPRFRKPLTSPLPDERDDYQGLYGLPVTGFAVQRFGNSFLGDGADVVANYGGIFQHKGTRSAEVVAVN